MGAKEENRSAENKRRLGAEKERIAAFFLKQQGYKILAVNYYTRFGEIDIIALEQDVLCFIEVKYRSTERFGMPAEAVDRKKQQHILAASACYLKENGRHGAVRYDVVEMLGDQIRLLKDAFQKSPENNRRSAYRSPF